MTPHLHNPRRVGAMVLAALLTAVVFGDRAAGANRAATPAEVKVLTQADRYLRSVGVPLPPVSRITYRVTLDRLECGDPDAYACADDDLAAGTYRVYLTPEFAADARRWSRATRYRLASNRAKAVRRCGWPCVTAANASLHELIHVARFTFHPLQYWSDRDVVFEEGLAYAVADDHTPAFVRRVTGARRIGAGLGLTVPTPAEEAVFAAFPTRASRLAAVALTTPPTLEVH